MTKLARYYDEVCETYRQQLHADLTDAEREQELREFRERIERSDWLPERVRRAWAAEN